MATLEQPQPSMREVPADLPVAEEQPAQPTDTRDTAKKPRELHFQLATHRRTIYTYPSEISHYMPSDLNRDIMENPALGFADF